MNNLLKIYFTDKTNLLKKIKVFLRHRNPIKYAFYRYEWNTVPKKNTTRDFPIHLGIEPTNACNLKCTFCARHHINYNFGYMNFELYKKIIDEGVKHGLRSVKLVRGGESLLHPRFVDMIKYARERGVVDIIFNTNATLLTPEKSLEIIKAKPDIVIFSVDAPDKQIYESQRVGASYEAVEDNIKTFIDLKNRYYPKITTSAHMVYTDETKHLVDKHIKRWENLTDRVTTNKANEYIEVPKNKEFRCRNPFRRLDITWDGSVYSCDPDFDPKGKLLLGNVKDSSIHALWHSTIMNKLRDNFKRNTRGGVNPCIYCRGA